MSIYINDVAGTLFDPMPKQAFQEKGFRLKNTCRIRNNVGGNEKVSFRKLGKSMAKQKALQDPMVPANLKWTPVEMTLQGWYDDDYSDVFGQADVNFDELTELAEALAMSIGRRADQLILDAAHASGTTNTIAANALGFTFDKYLQMNKYFKKKGIDPKQTPCFIAIEAEAEEDLLATKEFTSIDYNAKRILDNGSSLNGLNLFGYNWIVLGDMAEGGVYKSGNTYSAYAWAQPAMGLGIGRDFITQKSYEHKHLSWLVSVQYKANAVAIDKEGIVEINYV